MRPGTQSEIVIPPLVSGGIFLSYRCTSECRHCLYRSSPRQPDEWMSLETAERSFRALAREPDLGPIHIGGGEPFLKQELLEQVIRLAVGTGLRVAYVQTNAHWCAEPARTRHVLRRLRDAGLEGLYVSVSMFHNEFVPLWRSSTCVEAANEVFGPSNVTLWSPGGVRMYDTLRRMPDDGTHTLEEYRRWASEAGVENVLATALDDMIPRGRLVETLPGLFERRPADGFRGETCRAELMSTESSGTIFHFHIDHQGNLIMGCCAGIAPATIDDLHPPVTPETHPVFHSLHTGGPFGLMRIAAAEFDYGEREAGYAGKCDLCFDVRRHLHAGGGFAELRPDGFYTA